jgi:hypothetical protein
MNNLGCLVIVIMIFGMITADTMIPLNHLLPRKATFEGVSLTVHEIEKEQSDEVVSNVKWSNCRGNYPFMASAVFVDPQPMRPRSNVTLTCYGYQSETIKYGNWSIDVSKGSIQFAHYEGPIEQLSPNVIWPWPPGDRVLSVVVKTPFSGLNTNYTATTTAKDETGRELACLKAEVAFLR